MKFVLDPNGKKPISLLVMPPLMPSSPAASGEMMVLPSQTVGPYPISPLKIMVNVTLARTMTHSRNRSDREMEAVGPLITCQLEILNI
jgi:hypothetical protein